MIYLPASKDVERYIKKENLYKYLQIPDNQNISPEISDKIENSGLLFSELIEPYVVFREFTDFECRHNAVILADTCNIKSVVLSGLATKANSVFVCIVTIGELLEKKVASLISEGAYFMAQIADAFGSVLVEATLDMFIATTEGIISEDGYLLSALYSPGYCDIDISEQEKIFGILHCDNSRVQLNESFEMYPEKSISGLLFKMKKDDAIKYKKYFVHCSECNNRLCKYFKK
ncbi:MAG: hypothetical protein N3B13_08350 [Deltaproteobacteria bacterium]|nr:hypothetical protein [Deltaproteobacteria bacterium]